MDSNHGPPPYESGALTIGANRPSAAASVARREGLVERARAVEVVLHGDEEGMVVRELGEVVLRLVVDLVVALDLRDERRQAPGARHRRHAEEDPPRVVVLRD